jgi:hypothetical protein
VADVIALSYLWASFDIIVKHVSVWSIFAPDALTADAISGVTTMTIREPSCCAKIPLSDNARVVL